MVDIIVTLVLIVYWVATAAIFILWVMGKISIIHNEAKDMRKDKMEAKRAIDLAKKHIKIGDPAAESAALCLFDAEILLKGGMETMAKKRALDSLRYSVGIFHEDYKKANGEQV